MGKELIEYIAKALVDDPDEVEIVVLEGDKSTILELKVAENDMGHIIGKNGRIAKAMRTLLGVVTTKSEKQYALEILD